jgi:hypothetical protein
LERSELFVFGKPAGRALVLTRARVSMFLHRRIDRANAPYPLL